jgi:hypothetical protein
MHNCNHCGVKEGDWKSPEQIKNNRLCFFKGLAVFLGLFVLAFAWFLNNEITNVNAPIFGYHDWRQSHTAIIINNMTDRSSNILNYRAPILGEPSVIPQEFPVYQIVASGIDNFIKSSHIKMITTDGVARGVAIFFSLGVLLVFFLIGKELTLPPHAILAALSCYLVTAGFIYWSRAVLIESTALFLASLFAFLAIIYKKRGSFILFFLTLSIGILAALQKPTTWSFAALFIFLFILDDLVKNKFKPKNLITLLGAGVFLITPLAFAIIWNHHCDGLKETNYLANQYITSHAMKGWDFGTWEQKLNIQTYLTQLSIVCDEIVPRQVLPFFLLLLFLGSRKNLYCIYALAAFLAGPLIFTNLFFEHAYYWYETSFWLFISLAISFASLLNEKRGGIIVLLFCAVFGYFSYYSLGFYRDMIQYDSWAAKKTWDNIAKQTPKDGYMLILGYDWNPVVAYYCETKALYIPQRYVGSTAKDPKELWDRKLTRDYLNKAKEQTEKVSHIDCALVNTEHLTKDEYQVALDYFQDKGWHLIAITPHGEFWK